MRNLLTRRSSSGRARTRLNGSRAAVVLAGVLVAFVAALGVTSVAWAALSEHTVTGVSPRGTTINLFDYWVTNQGDVDTGDWQPDQADWGINANHTLKFGKGMGESEAPYTANSDNVNEWTKSAQPRTGIVSNSLGTGDYPVLSGALGGESLSYLFDGSSPEGKKAYLDVKGPLQVDGEGYYYYNSQRNFAQFNESTNDFTLYDAWGVKHEGSSPDGQFFPFNTGDEVLDGTSGITQKNVTSLSDNINHYFGLNMSTRFVQQNGGHTDESQATDVTYNFSGDDDVWIFIDGVLVGDLGGIHNATSIEINFATGNVVVYEDTNGNYQWDNGVDTLYSQSTLKSLFALNGDTFDDNTYHTLDFFYLERGNTDSNMYLKYNLVNIPESGVVKVDQYGNPLGDISFKLQKAEDESYQIDPNGMTVSGTTNDSGEFVFIDPNSSDKATPITLEQLAREGTYWVLTEEVPEGYRSAGEMHLRFEDGFLLSSNEWDTGAWAESHVTAIASAEVVAKNGGAKYDPADGVVFAVVFQKGKDGYWHPVSGNDEKGWNVANDTDNAAIVDAAKANNYQFLLGSGGGYEVTIEDLPGDILTYEYVINSNKEDPDDIKYAVRYYYVDGVDSVQKLTESSDLIEINPNADGRDFDRIFSVTLNVPNIKNELALVKTEADGKTPIKGVEFKLYADADRNGQADSDVALSTLTTGDDGTLQVYSDRDEQLLSEGSYVLVETTPTGYVKETKPIQIVVDDGGVHVNAGVANDNVTVETGIGDLVYSMRSFAADDQVDATLHEVKALPQTATAYEGESTTWGKAGEELHFQYQDEDDGANKYTYLPSNNGAATHSANAGWSRLNVTQCMSDEHQGVNNTDYKEPLGEDQSLNGLFTGGVTIHVTNRKLSSLTVEKKVKTEDGTDVPTGTDFEFTLKLTDANGNPLSGTFDTEKTDAEGNSTPGQLAFSNGVPQDQVKLKNGERITINGLPVGTKYEVTEVLDLNDYYNPSVSPATGDNDLSDGLTSTGTVDVSGAIVTFTNTFFGGSVDYTANLDLMVRKRLNGRDMKQGEFSVVVDPADDASANLFGLDNADEDRVIPMPASPDGDRVSVDILDGLNGITFTAADAGKKFTYTVREQVPAQNPTNGVTYDTAKYTLTIEVSVDADGVVSAKTQVSNETGLLREATTKPNISSTLPIGTFTNTYEADGMMESLSVTKELEGGTLSAGQFSFKLTGSDGAPMPGTTTATNSADGAVVFGPISFDAVGEYDYTITEVNDGQDGIAYDENVDRTVHVSVTDNERGNLVAKVTYGEDGSRFVNTVAPDQGGTTPDDPKDAIPRTGDDSFAHAPALALLGVAVVAGGIVLRRRLTRE